MSLGESVRIVAILGVHAPDAGGAVESATVSASRVAEHRGDEVLLRVAEGDEVAIGRGGCAAMGGGATPKGTTGGTEGCVALDLKQVGPSAEADNVRDVATVEPRLSLPGFLARGSGAVALVAKAHCVAGWGAGAHGGEERPHGAVVAGGGVGCVDGGVAQPGSLSLGLAARGEGVQGRCEAGKVEARAPLVVGE